MIHVFSIWLRTGYYPVPPDINWFEAIPKKKTIYLSQNLILAKFR